MPNQSGVAAGAARSVQLVGADPAAQRFAMTFTLNAPAAGAPAWIQFRASRPVMIETIAVSDAPGGALILDSGWPNGPSDPRAVAVGGAAPEILGGVRCVLPIQSGIIPPTQVMVPALYGGSGQYEFRIETRSPQTPTIMPWTISLSGRFLD